MCIRDSSVTDDHGHGDPLGQQFGQRLGQTGVVMAGEVVLHVAQAGRAEGQQGALGGAADEGMACLLYTS